MLAVIDTNVWVSAFLSSKGAPARLLNAFVKGHLIPVYSEEIEAEYLDVLYRDKLNIDRVVLDEFIGLLIEYGQLVIPVKFDSANLPDPDDAPFIAAALAAGCLIVTGNTKHFPATSGVEILIPAEALARLQAA